MLPFNNVKVRGVLIEIAWRAIEKDQALAQFYNQLFPRTGKKKAIVAVARKLIGRIRAAFQKGEIYHLAYPDTLL
jgi:transposase